MDVPALTRDDFQAVARGGHSPKALYELTRGADYDIRSAEWIAAAMPSEIDADAESWFHVWFYFNRWAGSVNREPGTAWHLDTARQGAWSMELRELIYVTARDHDWPQVSSLEDLETDELESVYALSAMASFVDFQGTWWGDDDEGYFSWRLALSLAMRSRGQLQSVYTEVSEYDGASRIIIAPTQLGVDEFGREIPRSRRVKIVDEWCDFFSSAPTPIHYLHIASRAPSRLVSSLSAQTQLRGLEIKWGDYDDISPIATMPHLWTADFGGATALADLRPLASARALRDLAIQDTRRAIDYSPISELHQLEQLTLSTGINSQALKVPNLDFLRGLASLRSLYLGLRVLDGDFTPLLDLPQLTSLWVPKQRGMFPPYDELVRRIPALR